MYYLSICAIHKHEAKWLDEWVDYHSRIGVEHFYLYCNDEDISLTDSVLRRFGGLVDNVHVPGLSIQMPTYNFATDALKDKTFWLAAIDIDEFLRPVQTDDVREVLREYEGEVGLGVNWYIYGNSGYMEDPPTQIDHLLWRAPDAHWVNGHIKSIVRPSAVKTWTNPHSPIYHDKLSVDEKFEQIPECIFVRKNTFDKLAINHYCIRSVANVWDKCRKGRADNSPINFRDYMQNNNQNSHYDPNLAVRFGHPPVEVL